MVVSDEAVPVFMLGRESCSLASAMACSGVRLGWVFFGRVLLFGLLLRPSPKTGGGWRAGRVPFVLLVLLSVVLLLLVLISLSAGLTLPLVSLQLAKYMLFRF